MASPCTALQAAILDRLAADPALLALLGGARIYDHVPQRAAFPFLSVGASSVRDWSTATEPGHEHTLTLNAWSRHRGRAELYAITDAIAAALEPADLTLDGHRLINLRVEQTAYRREGDGETFAATISLRAVTEPL